MITIYDKTNKTKEGSLSPLSCIVTEALNGAYELAMQHPYDDVGKWRRIEEENIIYADTPKGKQPFRIYNIQPDMDTIKVNARHIFYDLLDNFCESVNVTANAQGVLTAVKNNLQYSTPFLFNTDITASGSLVNSRKNPVELLLDTSDDAISFVNLFGGELDRDGYNVRMLSSIGADRGYRISYGKNLIGLSVKEDTSNVITRYLLVGADDRSYGYTDSARIGNYVNPKVAIYENSELSTKAALQAEAQMMFAAGADLPTVNITVDFVLLQNTEEYRNYAVLEEIYLGDVVTVINQKMNFSKKAKVIYYEYDAILKRYNKIELGDFMPTIYSPITSGVNSRTLAKNATAAVTSMATLLNGIVTVTDDALYICVDAKSISAAKKVFKFGQSGLQYSSTGVSGAWTTIIDANGIVR